MIRIFTLEYDPIKKSFDDSALSTFLAGKSVISIEKRFFKQNSRFFWTFAIEYETDKAGGTKDIELETDGQKGLFLALKEWRNELAAERGVPPYLLFTNNQLKRVESFETGRLLEQSANNCRVANRNNNNPNNSNNNIGFRLCNTFERQNRLVQGSVGWAVTVHIFILLPKRDKEKR